VQPAATVAHLCDALGTSQSILIHHDWSQQPGFALDRPNVSYVRHPHRTGWANWGFSQGILKLVEEALDSLDFDYFQLLSPTCLPIRPVESFAAHLEGTRADFYVDAVRLDEDRFTLLSHGWRAFAPESTWRHRVL